jgi:hypothetical protein
MRRPESVHFASDYLYTFYPDTAVETGWRAANRILKETRRRRG